MNRKNQKHLSIYGIVLWLVTCMGCAKIGSPTGGPKDITPPRVIETSPRDSSVNFIPTKNIDITFDEYIQLKDIYQELIVSPPLKEPPRAYIKNKSLEIEFSNKTIFDTTTYTISFGKAIADNNEGNVLKDYEYVFSVRNYIDSMNVEGRVVNSFNYLPDKDRMYVMLYRNLNDSAPLKTRPNYICRTNEKGYFSIHNIQNGKYRLFALKDVNSNMLYDLPNEQIAFSDSVIDLSPESLNNNLNTKQKKEFSSISDSSARDTIHHQPKFVYETEMVFFTKKTKNQYLTNHHRELPELLEFMFNEPLEDSLHLRTLNYELKTNWYILDSNPEYDTLKYWITDTSMISKDSLKFELRYKTYDTLGNPKSSIDTLLLIKRAELQPRGFHIRRNRGKETDSKEDEAKKNIKRIKLSDNIKNATAFDLNRNIEISSVTPAFGINAEKIRMFRIEDTIKSPIKFEVSHDSNSMYKFVIRFKPEEKANYKLLIPDSTITDIYGSTNDTLLIPFKAQAEDFYGTLIMKISNVKGPVILQLLDVKEKLINEKYFDSDRTITYDYLYPSKYILKLIIDSNGNRKWDTGDYLKKLQPERIFYYPKDY